MEQNKNIIALGFFDGVHLGHQALLSACVNMAKQGEMTPCAITFAAHPQSLFSEDVPRTIQTAADREMLLREFGMEEVLTLPVTKEVMSTDWQAFLERLLADGAAGFVCGSDFRFGAGGSGTAEKLASYCKEHGLACAIVPEQTLDGIRISSTHVRKLLEQGQMEEAARFLGHPHILSGQVTTGRQLGRTLGIPTANILIPEGVVVPKHGVYACQAQVQGQKFAAVTNIGNRPTVGGHRVTVEPWLLDFQGDLYGENLTLEFYKFLRPERKFDSLEELKAEIRENACQTREFFEKR